MSDAHEIGIIDKLLSIVETYYDSPTLQNRMLDVVVTYFKSDDDRKLIIERNRSNFACSRTTQFNPSAGSDPLRDQ